MDRRFFLASCAALCAAPALAQSRQAMQPRDIVVMFYKFSAGKDGKFGGKSAFVDKNIRQRYFSANLRSALADVDKKAAKEGPIIDFDPITNSQDPNIKELQIAPEHPAPGAAATPDKATVVATFKSYSDPNPSIIRYDFIKAGSAWKLDEIRGEYIEGNGKKTWSLRDIIKSTSSEKKTG